MKSRQLWPAVLMGLSALRLVGCFVLAAQGEFHPLAGPLSLDSRGVRVTLEKPYVVSRHETGVCLRGPAGESMEYRHRDEGGSVRIDYWGEIETDKGLKVLLRHSGHMLGGHACLSAPGLRWRMRVVALRLFSSEPIAIREVKWYLETG